MLCRQTSLVTILAVVVAVGCGGPLEPDESEFVSASNVAERRYLLEQIDDVAVAQIYADGFESLDTRNKLLVWHLYNAALAGRDIYYDQRYRHNLEMREVLEELITNAEDVTSSVSDAILRYTKLFWINTGPYNNLTARKFVLDVSPDEFREAMHLAERSGAVFPLRLSLIHI